MTAQWELFDEEPDDSDGMPLSVEVCRCNRYFALASIEMLLCPRCEEEENRERTRVNSLLETPQAQELLAIYRESRCDND